MGNCYARHEPRRDPEPRRDREPRPDVPPYQPPIYDNGSHFVNLSDMQQSAAMLNESPYEQPLWNLPKHMVCNCTSHLNETQEYARHAEKISNKRNRQKPDQQCF